jgi:hypothetical protein
VNEPSRFRFVLANPPRMRLSVLCFLYCSLSGSVGFCQITTGGALPGFSRITPTDSAGHFPGTPYSVSLSGQSIGSLSWTDTFDTSLEMGPDGTIGVAENPYENRSWIGLSGSFTYDLSGLNFSGLPTVAAIGLEFDTHVRIVGNAYSLVLRDGTNILSTISGVRYSGFGPWSFDIPHSNFLSTSQHLTVDLSLSGGEGQWFSEGVQVLVPEPSSLLLTAFGAVTLLALRKRFRA